MFKKTPNKILPGMTLVELIVTTAIFVLAMTGVSYLAFAGFRYYQFTINQGQILEEIQKSVTPMTREIREMRQADSGAFAIELAESNQLVYFANIDDSIDAERIDYYRNGDCLVKGITKPTGSPPRYLDENEQTANITCNVANATGEPIFTYYNDYPALTNPLSVPAQVHQVKIVGLFLRIESTGSNPIPKSKVFSEYIRPRNINKEEEN